MRIGRQLLQKHSGGSSVRGFTLVELLITTVIVAVLAMIAYPSYVNSITKTKRRAAEACLSSYATWMERFYTSNLRYDQDTAGDDVSLPTLDCATTQNTGNDYSYSLSGTPTSTTYTVQAVPQHAQASHDVACGTLTLDQTGQKETSGNEGPATCW